MPPALCIFNPTNTEVAQLSTQSTTWRGAIGAPGIHPDGEQAKTALWLWVREITWYPYTRGVRGRKKQNNADLKLLDNCVMNSLIIFGIVFMTATGLGIRHSHLASTLFHSLVPWWRPRRIRPQVTRLSHWIGELRNGHVANLQELYYTRLVRKMASYKILIQVLIV